MRKYRISVPLAFAASLLAVSLAAQVSTSVVHVPKPDVKAAKPASRSQVSPVPRPETSLLPASFAGWQSGSASQKVTDATQADSANAAALKEYGLTDALLNDYTRDSDTLKVRALRFVDASGAYGAYSFYRQSGWPKEQIGTGAASDNNRVLFWVGNVVVDAQFSHISAMSGSELRELASTIPLPAGNKSLAPPILASLPQKDMDGQSTHYALGPAGYTGPSGAANLEGVLPPGLVGFDRGAETATAGYKLQSGPATLTIINYPTPQMAEAQEKVIAAYLKAGNSPQHPFTKPLQDSNPTALEVRRSGPLVAVVSGDPIADEAHKLLESVHYEANISSLPGQANNEIQKTAKLIVAIITLVVVMFVAAVLLALFLGGGRALYRHLRGKPISSVFDEEFIRIDLSD
jgi:flagellar basal body-associated protein FliL